MMFKMIETKFSKRRFIESKNKNFKDSENSIKRTKKHLDLQFWIYDEE